MTCHAVSLCTAIHSLGGALQTRHEIANSKYAYCCDTDYFQKLTARHLTLQQLVQHFQCLFLPLSNASIQNRKREDKSILCYTGNHMKMFMVRPWHIGVATLVLCGVLSLQAVSYAQPFGVGVFGENVPFGDETSLSISLSAEADVPLAPSGGTFSGTDTHTVTVTSSDVVGYDLYVNTTAGTAMSNGIDTIPASANVTLAALATNSWGYNTTGSTSNFRGMAATQTLIHSASGPYTGGDDTDVTYGAKIDITKSAGTYSVDVTYTAVGQT